MQKRFDYVEVKTLKVKLILKIPPTPVAIAVSGQLSSLRDGDRQAVFSANTPLATFQCLLVQSGVGTPTLNSCEKIM